MACLCLRALLAFTLTSAKAELDDSYGGGWLRVEATGTGQGCDVTRPASVRFMGKKL